MKKDLVRVENLGGGVLFKYKNIRIINMLRTKIALRHVVKAIDRLPEEAIHQLQKRNTLIRIEKASEFEKIDICEGAIGFFNTENIIYIKALSSGKRIERTVIHEVGHFVDNCLSLENCFNSIVDMKFHEAVENECEYILKEYGEYYLTNIVELFAQSFYAYIENRKFKKKCPKISGAIESYVKQLACC